MKFSVIIWLFAGLASACIGCAGSGAKMVHMDRATFLERVFQGQAPEADYIWLTPDLRSRIADTLGRSYRGARIPYWQKSGKTLWILEDTAKDTAITAGIVIAGCSIVYLEIISSAGRYGAAVGNEAFTRQFRRASLKAGGQLDQHIDAVSGATFSSAAVSRLAELSLILNRLTNPS